MSNEEPLGRHERIARSHEPSESASSGRRGKSSHSSGRDAASRANATTSSVTPAASSAQSASPSGGRSEDAILARSATAWRPGSRARPARNRPAISAGSGRLRAPPPPGAAGARKEAMPWKRFASAPVSSERSSRTPRGGEDEPGEAEGPRSVASGSSSVAMRELAMERASHAIAGGEVGGRAGASDWGRRGRWLGALFREFPCHCWVGPVLGITSPGQKNT